MTARTDPCRVVAVRRSGGMEVNSAVVWCRSHSSRSQGLGHAVLVWMHTQPQMWEGLAGALTYS